MSKVVIKDKELFYLKEDNSYEKISLSEEELVEKIRVYNLKQEYKQELADQISLSFEKHCKYLGVGIFHHDTFCIDVIAAMKKTNSKLFSIRNNGEDHIFTTDDYIKFRNSQSLNTYQEYLVKHTNLIKLLIPPLEKEKIDDFNKWIDSIVRYKVHLLWRMFNKVIKKIPQGTIPQIRPLKASVWPVTFCNTKDRKLRSIYVPLQIKRILEQNFLDPFCKKYFIGKYNCGIIPYTNDLLLDIIEIFKEELKKLGLSL